MNTLRKLPIGIQDFEKLRTKVVYLHIENFKWTMMRAVEFRSKILENKILFPRKMQSELIVGSNKTVRVVVFLWKM